MGRKKLFSLKEAEAKLSRGGTERGKNLILSSRKLGNIWEDVALWLFWRERVVHNEKEKVQPWVIEELTYGQVTTSMAMNFLTSWYGIGEKDEYAPKIKKFSDLYNYFSNKRSRDLKRIKGNGPAYAKLRAGRLMPDYKLTRPEKDSTIEEYVEFWERQYQRRIDEIKKKKQKS